MLDIAWSELLLIAIVALIVIGPKELPVLFRTLGRFAAKMRGMAREFGRAMEQAADESGVKDVARDLRSATDLRRTGLDALKDAATRFESWDPHRPRPPGGAAPGSTGTPPGPPPATDPPPAAAAGPAAGLGPQTQALAEAQEARRAERAERLAAAAGMPPPAAAPPVAAPSVAAPSVAAPATDPPAAAAATAAVAATAAPPTDPSA
jgi:sec-independent protein translocase protein TatB